MKERPILFKADMVRAILDGRKTQTRRLVKFNIAGRVGPLHSQWHIDDPGAIAACPYGQAGDRLWLRETWGYRVGVGIDPTTEAVIEYQADGIKQNCRVPADGRGQPKHRSGMTRDELEQWWRQWRPSIHMPRWASRITLEVGAVRAERLQDITEKDAQAEGCDTARFSTDVPSRLGPLLSPESHRAGFACLWDAINAKRGPGWNANPWVWVVEFKRLEFADE